jgi:aspartate-semialdehyde dehydrogenase
MNAIVSRIERHPELHRLKDKRLLRELGYIDGRWVSTLHGAVFEVRDPGASTLISNVAKLGDVEADLAVTAASAAFPKWSGLLPQERAAFLRAWYNQIVAAREDLALILSLEQGKPIAEALGEIDYGASFVEWCAEEAKRTNVETVSSHLRNAELLVHRVPLGVAAIVTPWNFPNAMLARKAAAALAAGCTAVCNPSPFTPLSALALAELADRAGLPAGVLNIVPGDSKTIVERWIDDARVRIVSFTGSTQVGRSIYARCGATMKRMVMELGGHAPLIVFADSDMDKAVDVAVNAKFATSGQDCLAANRIFVQRPVYEQFCQAFAARVKELRVGYCLDAGVDIGPLMHKASLDKVRAQVRDAQLHGARTLVGPTEFVENALYFPPTVLADVSDDASIMHEETFGPVAVLNPFDSEDEVVSRANNTEYGLAAYVLTKDVARTFRIGRALQFGMVAVNRVKLTGAPVPFGGFKQSGLGKEGSQHGVEAFTDIQYICIDTAA